MRVRFDVAVLLAALLVVAFLLVACGQAEAAKRCQFLIAHRGVVTDGLVENSLPALEESIRRGYTHVEVDVRCTQDGTVVCIHDADLKRVAGIEQAVDRITLEELRKRVSSDILPTLDEFCVRCEGRINLMPDLKGTTKSLEQTYLAGIQACLERHGLLKSALFIGTPELLDFFDGKGRICLRMPADKTRAKLVGVQNAAGRYFVFNHAADFNQDEVNAFHQMGLPVIVSINLNHYREGDAVAQGNSDVQEMLRIGVDGLQIDSVYDEGIAGPIKDQVAE